MRHPVRVTVAVMVVGAAGLTLWFLATSSSGPSSSRVPLPDRVPLPGAVAFVRAGPAVIMVGGETAMAADPRLVVLPLPEGEPRILARGGDIEPPSPNGRRVVFPWARVLGPGPPVPSLYTVRVDGGKPSRLTMCRPPRCMGDRDPSWSPDGTRIAFLRASDAGQRLFLLDLAAARAHPIELPGLVPFTGASWSPDGRWLAFSAYPANASTPPEVYVVREDGTGLRRLTSCARPCRGSYADPAWSPDGRWIVAVQGYGRQGSLHLMEPDGTGIRRLTSPTPAGLEDGEAAWSPDGEWLVFVRGEDLGGDLYAMRRDGRELRQLTSGPAFDFGPAWVPSDGTMN